MEPLKEGELYLNLSIGGKTGIRVAMFKNKNKKSSKDPDYVGNIPMAMWKTKKKAKEDQTFKVDEEL